MAESKEAQSDQTEITRQPEELELCCVHGHDQWNQAGDSLTPRRARALLAMVAVVAAGLPHAWSVGTISGSQLLPLLKMGGRGRKS